MVKNKISFTHGCYSNFLNICYYLILLNCVPYHQVLSGHFHFYITLHIEVLNYRIEVLFQLTEWPWALAAFSIVYIKQSY